MPRVRVVGGEEVDARGGETLLEALRRWGVPLPAGCGGLGLCGMCRVRVLSGSLSLHTQREAELLGGQLEDGWRLACQARVLEDVTVEVQLQRAAVKFRVRPRVRISPPAVFAPFSLVRGEPSYEEELLRDLRSRGVRAERLLPSALNELSRRKSGVAVVVGDEVVDLADSHSGYGLAVDVGTTSVAVSALNLSSGALLGEGVELNGQLKYGSDIISRIRHALVEREGLVQLQAAAVETVNRLVERLLPNPERVYRVTVAGNTVMLHLFYRVDPSPLGFLPFKPVYRRSLAARGRELGLKVHPYARVESLPILGGYVGGDVVGDVLAARFSEYRLAMLIDVGTNGEVVVKRGDECVAASTPAGPAFEGVGLRSGMMAVEGAIERVRLLTGSKPEYEVVGEGRPRGICGSGYVDLLAELIRAGILDRGGKLLPKPRVREVDGVLAYVIDEGSEVVLTQQDVRKLQLAVAAVKIAAKFVLSALGVSARDLERVIVAGDFGYHLDPENAMEIGLLPRVEAELIEYIGNGSLTGAEMYMLSEDAREEANRLVEKCRVLDVPRDERAFIRELRLVW